MALSKSNLSSTKDCQNCLNTCALVYLALSLNSAFGQLLPVFSSNKIFSSSHAAVVHGGILHACPPITGSGSRCHNMIDMSRTRSAWQSCHQGSSLSRQSRSSITTMTNPFDPPRIHLSTKAQFVWIRLVTFPTECEQGADAKGSTGWEHAQDNVLGENTENARITCVRVSNTLNIEPRTRSLPQHKINVTCLPRIL